MKLAFEYGMIIIPFFFFVFEISRVNLVKLRNVELLDFPDRRVKLVNAVTAVKKEKKATWDCPVMPPIRQLSNYQQ